MSMSRYHEGVKLALKCSAAGCAWHTIRFVLDEGYGTCPKCGAALIRRPPAFAEIRAAKAKADLERMGR